MLGGNVERESTREVSFRLGKMTGLQMSVHKLIGALGSRTSSVPSVKALSVVEETRLFCNICRNADELFLPIIVNKEFQYRECITPLSVRNQCLNLMAAKPITIALDVLQMKRYIGIFRCQSNCPLIPLQRNVHLIAQIEKMTKLERHVLVFWLCREDMPILHFGVVVTAGLLEHMAKLHAEVQCGGFQFECTAVMLNRCRVIGSITRRVCGGNMAVEAKC